MIEYKEFLPVMVAILQGIKATEEAQKLMLKEMAQKISPIAASAIAAPETSSKPAAPAAEAATAKTAAFVPKLTQPNGAELEPIILSKSAFSCFRSLSFSAWHSLP